MSLERFIKISILKMILIGLDYLQSVKKRNDDLNKSINQLECSEILMFIYDRFLFYRKYKTQHRQWDITGNKLFELSIKFHDNPERFLCSIMSTLV